jgi:hypothetical protein
MPATPMPVATTSRIVPVARVWNWKANVPAPVIRTLSKWTSSVEPLMNWMAS